MPGMSWSAYPGAVPGPGVPADGDLRPEQAPVPDWMKLAEAYGWTGFHFEKKETLVDDLKKALATEGPVLVDVRVAREENVYPMIAPGAAARDMVG